ncbi:MAG TPA: hypothetical protein VKH18_08945 [Terriglobales bacterium]|nr:hypothetical protein [Terriglobales bacterium]
MSAPSSSIPNFNASGVLPPYVGSTPADVGGMSPYVVTIDQLIARFNTSPERKAILNGFLSFRQSLRSLGLSGWQWVDGSFLESVEDNESRPPRDIDILTFFARPASIPGGDWNAFVAANSGVFNPAQAKASFRCDAYFVDTTFGPYFVVRQTGYWFGLFSHQRITEAWKGLLEISLPLTDVDAAARAALV